MTFPIAGLAASLTAAWGIAVGAGNPKLTGFFSCGNRLRGFFLDIKKSYALDQINRYSTTEYLKPQTPIGHVYPNLSHCKMPGSHTPDRIQYLILAQQQ